MLSPPDDGDCALESAGVDSGVGDGAGEVDGAGEEDGAGEVDGAAEEDGAGEEGSLGGESSSGGTAELSDAHALLSVAFRHTSILAEYASSSSSHWHPVSLTYVM